MLLSTFTRVPNARDGHSSVEGDLTPSLSSCLTQSGECDPVEQGRVAQEAPYVEPVFRPPPGCTPSRGQSNTNSAQASVGCAWRRETLLSCHFKAPRLLRPAPSELGARPALHLSLSIIQALFLTTRFRPAPPQVSYLFGGHGDAAGPDPSYFEPPPSPGAVRETKAARPWRLSPGACPFSRLDANPSSRASAAPATFDA